MNARITLIVALLPVCGLADPAPAEPAPASIQTTASQLVQASIVRSNELTKRILELAAQGHQLVQSSGGDQSKLSPDQRDQLTQLASRLLYLGRQLSGEVDRRRHLEEIIDLATIDDAADSIRAQLADTGQAEDPRHLEEETAKEIRAKFGEWGAAWQEPIEAIKQAHEIHVALTISFEGLEDRLKNSRMLPGPGSDDLQFFYEDNFEKSVPYGLFRGRLDRAVQSGDPAAKQLAAFLATEWKG